MKTKLVLTFGFLLILSFPVAAQQEATQNHSAHGLEKQDTKKGTIWTCSMHPQIRLPKPGKCPLCRMDLIPIETNSTEPSDNNAPTLTLNERASKLMEIRTSLVERKWAERSVRLIGKIDYDETRVKHITAWVPGRIDRMFVDYAGIEVRKNDHMVSLYSPNLVSAQEELIQAARSLGRIKSGSAMVKRSTRRSLQAAREKLKLLGLTTAQVSQIEKRGKTEDNVTVYSPIGGTVIQKHVSEGMYVQTGTRIYTIADLAHLWLNLDAYESDLPWVQYGQKVEFSAEALPGEAFKGIVSFVQPILDEKTRTVKVRVNVDNQSKRLKPGMFVTAMVKSRIDSNGEIVPISYAGKYVCPMHPEIVAKSEGSCPICGMDLAQAETLPFVDKTHQHDIQAPIVIPTSAPLITGKRAVVYIKHPKKSQYEGRNVVLGVRAGDYYVVKSGLSEGELVVTNGAFKLDADLQIRGSTSMMNPSAGTPTRSHQH